MPNEYDFDLQQDRVRQQFLLLNSWCGAPQVYDLEEKYCSYPTQPSCKITTVLIWTSATMGKHFNMSTNAFLLSHYQLVWFIFFR